MRDSNIFNTGQTAKGSNTMGTVQLGNYGRQDGLDGLEGGWMDLWDTVSTTVQSGVETVFTASVDDYVEEKIADDPDSAYIPEEEIMVIEQPSAGIGAMIKENPLVAVGGVFLLLKMFSG